MPKKFPVKKSVSKFQGRGHVQKKVKRPKLKPAHPRELRRRGWMIVGADTSMSSLAFSAIGWDATLKKFRGPKFLYVRWEKEDEYLDRLREAARPEEYIHDLQNQLGLILNTDEIFIAQEEPVPMKLFGKGTSAFLKQQCEVSGAFLGGLMRYGYTNLTQINSMQWRQLVAAMISEDTGEEVTIHHSKWRSSRLAKEYNCTLADSGKFRSKQWALDVMAPYFGQQWNSEIPDWTDIIESKDGKKPRPEGSKARAVQPDDRYDSLAILWSHYLELQELGLLDKK